MNGKARAKSTYYVTRLFTIGLPTTEKYLVIQQYLEVTFLAFEQIYIKNSRIYNYPEITLRKIMYDVMLCMILYLVKALINDLS